MQLLDRHHAQISEAAKVAAENTERLENSKPTQEALSTEVFPVAAANDGQQFDCTEAAPLSPDPGALSKAAQLSIDRRARRLEKYQKVVALKDSGMSLRAISRELGIGRDLVKKFFHSGTFPERAKTRRPRRANPVAAELKRLWDSNI